MSTYGYVGPNSTQQLVNFIASRQEDSSLLRAVGSTVYFDTLIEGRTYRAVGTISNIKTVNDTFDNTMNSIVAGGHMRDLDTHVHDDLRLSSFQLQAVFAKDAGDTQWKQEQAYLPTSPSTQSQVKLLTNETIQELTHSKNDPYPCIGTFRSDSSMFLPINTLDFGGNRGAYHSAVVGKSGSGKTAGYTFILSTYMRHPQHAILVVDPQGQWSNENGFIFSPQEFARGLGRDVKTVRISEEIRLPRNAELIGHMATVMNAWKKMRRMGKENAEIFSDVVAEVLCELDDSFNRPVKEVLSETFLKIASSDFKMGRIYADEKAQLRLNEELYILAGRTPPTQEEGSEYMEEAFRDAEKMWETLEQVFTPLFSLFSHTNIDGEKRQALSGPSSFLSEVFQVRTEQSNPAPYIIVDMSPDQKNNERHNLNPNDPHIQMKRMLDNDSVKALILQVLFAEIKKASETAFASGGQGTLNTQIVFDEAWRYAPEGPSSPEITELASMLEGFARDTRKFGIGWTYILQSPTDLKTGIWNQVTYVYAAYGLTGKDVTMLEDRYDETSQTNIYKGFISPGSTQKYPMMIVGSLSPLIFTNAPTFLNMFNDAETFLEANQVWIRQRTNEQGLPMITGQMVDPLQKKSRRKTMKAGENTSKAYNVGKTYTPSTPQTAQKRSQPSKPVEEADGFQPPF